MFKKALLTATAAGLLSSAFAATANDDPADNRWYLSAFYSFYNAERNWNADGESIGYQISVGKHLGHHFGLEAAFSSVELDTATADTRIQTAGVNLLYYPLGREYGMYTTLGAGQADVNSVDHPVGDYYHYDAGIGFVKGMLRGEVKGRYGHHEDTSGTFGNDYSIDYIANIGFIKSFGENQGSDYATPIYDGDPDKRFYLNLGAAQNLTDRSHNIENDSGTAYRVGFGMYLRRTLSAELYASQGSYDIRGGGQMDETNYGIDLFMHQNRNPEFSPYVVFGAGVTEVEGIPVPGDGNHVDLGFGFLSSITAYRLGIRFDVRYRTAHLDNTSRNTHAGIVNLGLNVPFGAPPALPDDDDDGVPNDSDNCPRTPANTPVDGEGCPLDSDNDGVIDPQDACPTTPAGTEVDARGCALDQDSDGDGVNDSKDECPATPAGVAVGENGCPIDDDNDGVVNDQDDCPDTPAGLEVNSRGCVESQSAVLKGVNFEFNSATLTPQARRILDDVAAVWESQSNLAAEVSGHTDWMGPSDYNLQLSQLRAEAVKSYLVSKGVPSAQLDAQGYGESRPIADNETDAGRAENRRVELEVH